MSNMVVNPYFMTTVCTTQPSPDPTFANNSALLHFDTDFTDQTGNVWTPHGNAQITSVNTRFGSGCGLFDGTGDYIETPDNADFDFGSGNFTIESWINLDVVNASRVIIGQRDLAAGASQFAFRVLINATGEISFGYSTNGSTQIVVNTSGAGIMASTWYHVAVVRNSGDLLFFKNGSLLQTSAIAGTIFNSDRAVKIGAIDDTPSTFWIGRLDELRVKKGVAQYTGNFNIQCNPFANS